MIARTTANERALPQKEGHSYVHAVLPLHFYQLIVFKGSAGQSNVEGKNAEAPDSFGGICK